MAPRGYSAAWCRRCTLALHKCPTSIALNQGLVARNRHRGNGLGGINPFNAELMKLGLGRKQLLSWAFSAVLCPRRKAREMSYHTRCVAAGQRLVRPARTRAPRVAVPLGRPCGPLAARPPRDAPRARRRFPPAAQLADRADRSPVRARRRAAAAAAAR